MKTAELAEWIKQQRSRLIAHPLVGYETLQPPCAEPVAMAAIAATAHRWREPAEACCRCLLAAQQRNGGVSVRLDTDGPFWTTSLACIAWRCFELAWPERARPWSADAYRRAVDYLLSFGGEKIDPSENVGHNTQLVGWPWVVSTHSWLEPTAFALLALRHCQHAEHPRAIEAAELIVDRFLPGGGMNYGNTIVLGQVLRPHVLPSAICMVALHRSQPAVGSLDATCKYLRGELTVPLAAVSLAWAMQAIVSAEWEQPVERTTNFDRPLQIAMDRLETAGRNPHRLNMLLWSVSQRASPILDLAPLQLPHLQTEIP